MALFPDQPPIQLLRQEAEMTILQLFLIVEPGEVQHKSVPYLQIIKVMLQLEIILVKMVLMPHLLQVHLLQEELTKNFKMTYLKNLHKSLNHVTAIKSQRQHNQIRIPGINQERI